MDFSVHNKLVSYIWSIANDELRNVYARGKYRDVILPMFVLRCLDCLLEKLICLAGRKERRRELDLYKRYASDPDFKHAFDLSIMRILDMGIGGVGTTD